MEGEPVQRVGGGLGLAVDVDHRDIGRGESARKRRGSLRRLASPVEVRGSEGLGRLDVPVAKGSLRELRRDGLDCVVQGLLEPESV